MKHFLGVDPGVNGGMAILREDRFIAGVWSFTDMKIEDLATAMRAAAQFMLLNNSPVAYLEKVGYMKGDGGKGSFTFGKVFGGLDIGFTCLGLHVVRVPPMLWMSRLQCLTGGNKKVTLNVAKGIFPTVFTGKTQGYGLAVADALLIAEYARRLAVAEEGRTTP